MLFATASTADAAREPRGLADALRDYLHCGVLLFTPPQTVALLTPETGRMLGLPGPETPGTLDSLPEPLRALVREAAASARPLAERHLEWKPEGGPRVVLHARATPIPGPLAGSPVLVVLHDAAPLQRLEQALWHLDRLASLGTLSAGMAHEIKNALVAVKTFIDLLLEKDPGSELAGVAKRELCRIEAIVASMLKFSGSAKGAFHPVRLHEFLDHSLRLIGPQIQVKSVSLARSFQAPVDLILANNQELHQALMNLLLNALDAMGADGVLTVATDLAPPEEAADCLRDSPEPARLRVTIQDTGRGIDPEHLPHLFDPFFTTKANGTGLGLAITRRIIQEHRGTIAVQSQPGVGTVFTLLLPILDPG